ncbi:MAG: DUF6751 family protein [Candidatus Pelethousia sp.]|nr:DUF6751 family protein [Candidatus Pelethousia sp.]
MQLADATVSLFHKVLVNREWEYEKHLLEGISWYSSEVSAVTDDGLKTADKYIVRMPFMPSVLPAKGDFMVLGDAEYNDNMKETYGASCMVVTAVTDNYTRPPRGKHFKVVGA